MRDAASVVAFPIASHWGRGGSDTATASWSSSSWLTCGICLTNSQNCICITYSRRNTTRAQRARNASNYSMECNFAYQMCICCARAFVHWFVRLFVSKEQFWEELIAYFHWYDIDRIENDGYHKSSTVACVFFAAVTLLQSRCLATIGKYTYRHTDWWEGLMK
jgi:hypothetical protein